MDKSKGLISELVHYLQPPVFSLQSIAKLLWWLGPWTKHQVPGPVIRTECLIQHTRPIRAYLYSPARGKPVGAYLIAPGLHFLGPDDPRLDRFCCALSAAGLLVLAPFLPDYISLRISPDATDDLAAAWDHLAMLAIQHQIAPPAIFSISFGCIPAIALAGRDSHRHRIGPLLLFGGFADFHVAVRFAVTGHVLHQGATMALPHDPLNSPAVFSNLLPYLNVDGDSALLDQAWQRMAHQTWGRMELKQPGARDPFGARIAESLPPSLRETFLIGCGLLPGGDALLDAAFTAAQDAFRFTDPRPALERIRTPVIIVHGRDDDVIPWFEAEKLQKALPAGHPHRLFLTGLYGHTGSEIPRLRDLVHELSTLLSLARTMIDVTMDNGLMNSRR